MFCVRYGLSSMLNSLSERLCHIEFCLNFMSGRDVDGEKTP